MGRRSLIFISALLGAFALCGFGPSGHPHASNPKAPPPAITSRIKLDSNYGKLPLAFEPNRGQDPPQVKFLSHGGGYSLFLTGSEAVILLKKHAPKFPLHPVKGFSRAKAPPPPDVLRLKLEGADPGAVFEGHQPLPGVSNYFTGKDPSHWVTGIPQYGRVEIHGVYPGVDMAYYGNQRKLEYDFKVNPGADPRAIRMKVEGADSVQTDGEGNLQLNVKGRKVLFRAPQVYQEEGGGRQPVGGRYAVAGGQEVSFEVEAYDKTRPLVIDPVLDYGTYLGGTAEANAIAVDASGDAYITGGTQGGLPASADAFQASYGTKVYSGLSDVFVSKLDPTGSILLYSTYLGGTDNDIGFGIAVDGKGDAYVTGLAGADFPTTAGAYQTAFGGDGGDYYGGDAFFSKLGPGGSTLLYSTYLGGTGWDEGTGVAVDNAGNAHLTGWTTSSNFPVTPGAFKTAYAANEEGDLFAAKLNPAGGGSSDLVYSTFLGESSGSVFPSVYSNIAIGPNGNPYVVGATNGNNFSTTPGAFEPAFVNGGENIGDNFVLELNPAGSGLVFSTYVGPNGLFGGYGIAFDSNQDIYFTATSQSANYPTSPGAYSPTYVGGLNAVVAEVNPTGSALLYSTFLEQAISSTGYESWAAYPTGIATDDCGNIYVVGSTSYPGYPITSGAWESTTGSLNLYGFFSVLDPSVTGNAQLVFSTFMGNGGENFPEGMAQDPSGNLYVTGDTNGGFPTTAGAYQTAYSGGAFAAKIDISSLCTPLSTNTPMPTPVFSYTPTPTPTATETPTGTSTPTASPSRTPTSTQTATNSPTWTATPTPSWTPTSTPIFTRTPTPTATPTTTQTPTSTQTPFGWSGGNGFGALPTSPPVTVVTIGCPFPNPLRGNGPLSVQVQSPAGCRVRWSCFTTDLRRIRDVSAALPRGAATLSWDGRDDEGNPAANGLYYLRVEVTGSAQASKILKVLLTR